MTILTGGLRERMLHDNLFNMLQTSMEALGWFSTGRQHAPVNMVPYPMDRDQEIPINTVALSDENVDEDYWEMGDYLTQHRWTFYIDVYAESPALGIHLRGDLEAILKGRLPNIGRNHPVFDVYDLTQATPPFLFYCEIENVVRDKGQEWSGTKPWMKFWYVVRFEVWDYWGQSSDAGDLLSGDVLDGGMPAGSGSGEISGGTP